MLDAAKAMKLSAKDLLNLKIIDEIIQEPIGGAHRDRDIILENVRDVLNKNLNYFNELDSEDIINDRKNKFLKIGRNDGFMSSTEDLSTLTVKKNDINRFLKSKKFIFTILVSLIVIASILLFK